MSLIVKGILLCLIVAILFLIIWIVYKRRRSIPEVNPNINPNINIAHETPVTKQSKQDIVTHTVTKTPQIPMLV
jgi:cell division protein FtsL